MNLWAVFIKPLFDYGSILCTISGTKLAEGTLIKRINGSFKRTVGFRKTTSNEIINLCLGYSPLKFAQEKTKLSLEKWQAHYDNNSFPKPDTSHYINTNPILINWHEIKIHNVQCLNCAEHPNTRLSSQHCEQIHNIKNIDLPAKLREGFHVMENFYGRNKRKNIIMRYTAEATRAKQTYNIMLTLIKKTEAGGPA